MPDAATRPVAPPPLPETRPQRRRGRPRDASADERILEAAGQLILERGFDKVTVDDVAALAKAGKATVYRRWASKEDLAVAALSQLYRHEIPVPDTGSVRDDLEAYYRSTLEFAGSESGRRYLHTTIGESLRDPRVQQLHRAAVKSREDLVRKILERGVARGEIRADVPLDLPVDYIGAVLSQAIISGRPVPSPDQVPQILDFLFRGIGTTTGTPGA